MEALLQESNLTLATVISKCQAQEAAKKQRASLASQQSECISMLQRPREKGLQYCQHQHTQDVELQLTQLDTPNAPPMAKHATIAKKSAILPRSVKVELRDTTQHQHKPQQTHPLFDT